MKINNFILKNSKMNFHKFKKKIKSRLKIIIYKIPQFAKIKNNVFTYFSIFQIFFSIIKIIFLKNLFIIIIIILKSFFNNEKMRIKFIIII